VAGKADFSTLVDWMNTPPPNNFVRPAIGAVLYGSKFEQGDVRFQGTIAYYPARGDGQWYPEHFQGTLQSVSGPASVNMAMAVHDRGATFDLTGAAGAGIGWEEYDVQDPVTELNGAVWFTIDQFANAGYRGGMILFGTFIPN